MTLEEIIKKRNLNEKEQKQMRIDLAILVDFLAEFVINNLNTGDDDN